MRLQTALVYDGVILLTETFKQLGLEQIQPINLYCIGNDTMWEKGLSISNFMRNVCLVMLKLKISNENVQNYHLILFIFQDNYRWNNKKCKIR